MSAGAVVRSCGECTLCCTLLRVDELRKLGGTPCPALRAAPAAPGCGIHATRPAICRAYSCLWLAGGLDPGDRPDRLGAVLDVATEGGVTRLRVHEARPGAYDGSPRLREIVARYRESMPVRIADAARLGASLGLTVHAGHGLHYHNVQPVAAIDEIVELNIGHAIVARAIVAGIAAAVSEMRALMLDARRSRPAPRGAGL